MDFGSVLYAAHKNDKTANRDGRYYKTKFEPPKKEVKSKPNLSANIKKFLEKRDVEEKRKVEDEKRKKEELLALRSQDKKSFKRVQTMLKRTKSANKSVMEDAIDNDNTVVTMAGPQQCDEDDYGYVSQEASSFYAKLMDKYASMPPEEPKFSESKKAVVKDLNAAKDRVRAALLKQEEEEMMPHKRKRKTKAEKLAEENGEVEDQEEDSDGRPRSREPSPAPPEPKPKKPKKMLPPPMDFSALLKLAEQKQHEPIKIEKKVASSDEEEEEDRRPMTKKQRIEYERERKSRERRKERENAMRNSQKRPQVQRKTGNDSDEEEDRPMTKKQRMEYEEERERRIRRLERENAELKERNNQKKVHFESGKNYDSDEEVEDDEELERRKRKMEREKAINNGKILQNILQKGTGSIPKIPKVSDKGERRERKISIDDEPDQKEKIKKDSSMKNGFKVSNSQSRIQKSSETTERKEKAYIDQERRPESTNRVPKLSSGGEKKEEKKASIKDRNSDKRESHDKGKPERDTYNKNYQRSSDLFGEVPKSSNNNERKDKILSRENQLERKEIRKESDHFSKSKSIKTEKINRIPNGGEKKYHQVSSDSDSDKRHNKMEQANPTKSLQKPLGKIPKVSESREWGEKNTSDETSKTSSSSENSKKSTNAEEALKKSADVWSKPCNQSPSMTAPKTTSGLSASQLERLRQMNKKPTQAKPAEKTSPFGNPTAKEERRPLPPKMGGRPSLLQAAAASRGATMMKTQASSRDADSQKSADRPSSKSSEKQSRPPDRPQVSKQSSAKPSTSQNELRPKQFPPSDLKPKQFPPSDLRPKQFPPSDLKPKQFPPSDLKPRPKQFPPQDMRGRQSEIRKKPKPRRIDSEDEVDSEMDDFIDDSEDMSRDDIAQAIKSIFNYDKSRWNNEDDDDDECMESNFGEIDKEERISLQIGAREDMAELEKEMAMKKKKKAMMKRR